jgi:hypothetical protein
MIMPDNELCQKSLKQALKYDKYTGIFKRLSSYGPVKKGDIAGSRRSDGYEIIHIFGKPYYSHRLAWLYEYGYMPENAIDHINRNPSDNRIKNLREVSRICNSRNCKLFVTNSSGVKGVSWVKRMKKWGAYITINYKRKHIGFFNDFDEAVCHRLAAEQCVGWGGCRQKTSAKIYVKKMLNNKLGV